MPDKILRVFLVGLVASTANAAPANTEIVQYYNTNDGSGTYSFYYELSDGTKRKETGYIANQGTPEEFLVVQGFYSYYDPNGKLIEVSYIADDKGFQVKEGPTTEYPILGAAPPISEISGTVLGTLVGGGIG